MITVSGLPYIFDVDGNKEFQKRVIHGSHQQPVLVDIGTDWCGPCLALDPILERVIPEYRGRVVLAKIDADENMKIAGHYRVRGFPTVILFIDGEEVDRFHSAKPFYVVREFIDRNIPPTAPDQE